MNLIAALLIVAALPAWAGYLRFEPQTVRATAIPLGCTTGNP